MTSEEFYKQYNEQRVCCPKCFSGSYMKDLAAFIVDMNNPEAYKDRNECVCTTCGDVHIFHDRVQGPKTNEMNQFQYLVRPDDHAVFSLNDDGMTYSLHEHKVQWPNNLHHKYSFTTLLRCGFFVGDEDKLEQYKMDEEDYHEMLRREYRTDGHGDGEDNQ